MTEPAPDTTTTTTRRRPPQLAHLVCCEVGDRSLCGRHLDGPAFIAERIAPIDTCAVCVELRQQPVRCLVARETGGQCPKAVSA